MTKDRRKRNIKSMIASAEGGSGWLHRISEPTVWREGIQIREEEDDNRPMERSEEKKKE